MTLTCGYEEHADHRLLLGLPTAVLLALAALAVLAGKLFRLSSRGAGPGPRGVITSPPILVGQVPTVFAQTGRGGERDKPFGLRSVVAYWRHRQDEPAPAKADRLDQDRTAGSGQDDHITGIDIASKDHVLHR